MYVCMYVRTSVCLCIRFVICWAKTITKMGTRTERDRDVDVDVLRRMLSPPSETQNNLALKCADGRAKNAC